ncbi:ATP-binding protein [Catellatospora bangladeshensis]|uniref:AAA family ATPase n=1 Tax=Catellatospora bangladeshensis TaxID=310355 RepID=UPI0036126FE1
MLAKPEAVFDRHAEWEALARFATSPAASARFGVVSGRRRQGKTFLLDALARATDGFYFAATEDTELESLRRFGRALAARAGTGGAFELHSWEEALRRLYAVVPDGLIIIDELPYLLSASPLSPPSSSTCSTPAEWPERRHPSCWSAARPWP